MYLPRTDRDPFEPSALSHGTKCVERRSVGSSGIGTCFSHRRECRDNEAAAGMERALASFRAAVAKEYGLEQAAKAAEDWIEEFEIIENERHFDWRSVTIRAARRLAVRVVALA